MRVEVNGRARELPDGATVADLVAQLGLRSEHVAVERNGEVVPRDRRAEVRLAEGDALEVVTLVGGG